MATPAEDPIEKMVRRSCASYKFCRRGDIVKGDLIRIDKHGRVDRLIDGRWIKTARSSAYADRKVWKAVSAPNLTMRTRRFLLPDLNAKAVASKPGDRLRRLRGTRLWRWIVPPLQSGAARKLSAGKIVNRCRASYIADLSDVKGKNLAAIEAQIVGGYEASLGRISRVEQRAGVFLGASVLTSSLVLGNAGLLLGSTGSLKATYLQLAAAALAIASACAIIGAFRALQTTMFTFSRVTPTNAREVLTRLTLTGDELKRDYVASVFVAASRAATIADWKVSQLKAARRWILGTTAGVVALTIIVLIDAVWG